MWLCAIYLTIFESLFHFLNILFQCRLHIILFFIYACVVLKKFFFISQIQYAAAQVSQ